MDADLAPMREVSLAALIATLASANIMLALFNLLPAFPLDGGRVLRGLLAWRLGSSRATRIATVVGKVVAVGLGVLAVTGGSLVLALIAVFIYFGATAEQNEHRTRDALAGLRAGDATNRGALSLSPADQVGAVASLLVRTPQRDFPVVHGESLVGIVSRDLVLAALRAGGPSQYVAGVMDRGPLAIDAALALPDARRFMMERGQRVAAVFDGSHFVGLLSLEDLAEVALVQEAARAPGRTGSVTDRPA
jgi:CBS domain-containing protein